MHLFCGVRFFLDIAYKGTRYHGWQVQSNARTVQAEINKALSKLLQVETTCVGSGRTDTGVHARQQIAHFDADLPMPAAKFQHRLNSLLPKHISINEISQVTDDAHARFDALSRTYHYHIHQHKDPFLTEMSYLFTLSLDVSAIQSGISILKNWRNFQAFSKVHTEVSHFDCEIYDIDWKVSNGQHLFSVRANRFLRGMVRAMVGTLLELGLHRLTTTQLIDILQSRDRSSAGRSVPPEGLYLTAITYPETVFEQ